MNAKILIVEDELLIAENHKDKLNSFGIDQVKIALSENEARQLMKDFIPDLILLDVRLRERFEGIDFGLEIRETMKIPIVFITAHSDVQTLQRILQVEPEACLSKPVRSSELHSAVSIALLKNIDASKKEHIVLKNGGETIRFNEEDFIFAQSSGNYIQLFIENRKREIIRLTLEQLLIKIERSIYLKINRSTIINIHKVTNKKGKKVMIGEQVFSISPKALEEFDEKFSALIGIT